MAWSFDQTQYRKLNGQLKLFLFQNKTKYTMDHMIYFLMKTNK